MAFGAVALWALSLVGLFYLLKLIRLREAMSAGFAAMNRIKEVTIETVGPSHKAILTRAFLWRERGMPPAGRPWTVFHFSALQIAFLNAVILAGSGLLLAELRPTAAQVAALMGVAALFFAHQAHCWRLMLGPAEEKRKPEVEEYREGHSTETRPTG